MMPDHTSAEVCIANIGPRQRQRRARLGLWSFGAAAIIVTPLILTGVAREWRLVAALPIWFGAYLWVQAREST